MNIYCIKTIHKSNTFYSEIFLFKYSIVILYTIYLIYYLKHYISISINVNIMHIFKYYIPFWEKNPLLFYLAFKTIRIVF